MPYNNVKRQVDAMVFPLAVFPKTSGSFMAFAQLLKKLLRLLSHAGRIRLLIFFHSLNAVSTNSDAPIGRKIKFE